MPYATGLWRIELLGGLCIRQGDRALHRFRAQKPGALLAYLAYYPRRPHPREVLVELLWPEGDPQAGRNSLNTALSSLRRQLEPPGTTAGTVLQADRFTVQLNPGAFATDVVEFQEALRDAHRSRNSQQQIEHLHHAMELYQGELLTGYYEDWIFPEQRRLADLYTEAVQRLATLQQQAKSFAFVLDAPRQRGIGDSSMPATRFPTGTVTFLMTDIEGSTRQWERSGDAFPGALADHHRLLRREFTRFQGYEVKEMGDGFLVAFARAADALACAVAGQRALAAHPWPEAVGPLRVRMALHTGDADAGDGEYQGLVLHRASRLLSAAHGDQILCSESTASLLMRDLPPELDLTDKGAYRLRDVPIPMRLFAVSYPGMPIRDLQPPNAPPEQSGNLPLLLTRFWGRESELSRLRTLLDAEHPRLITLSGPGGTGKTRLALEIARQSMEKFANAVWFVPLADLRDGHLLYTAILQTMRISPLPEREPKEQVITALERQPSLLVLDNLEQVAEEVAAPIYALLTRVPSVKCLVTSRQRLSLPGEQEFAVAPLQIPNGADTPILLMQCDSVRLFVDRAQAVKPDFQVTERNAAAVAALCDRLEGLPLAIELAAARAQVLPPAQMLAQMERSFDFLSSRQRVTEERHRTLRAAIDWSFQLLDPTAQRLFTRLSVFRGGWTLEAAADICEEDQILDRLTLLHDASLIRGDATGETERFHMLNLLQAFAEEQLTETERTHRFQRHAMHYLELAERAGPELRGAGQIAWLEKLEPEHDNLRAALDGAFRRGEQRLCARLAAALYPLLYHRGLWEEARRCLVVGLEAVSILGDAAHTLHVRLQCDLAGLHFDMGDWAESVKYAQASQTNCREQEDSALHAEILNLMGLLAMHKQDHETARKRFLEVLELRADPHGRALAFHNLARLASGAGDHKEAQRLYERALLHRRAAGDVRGEAETLGNLGAIAYLMGDRAEARRLYLESLQLYRDVRFPLGVASMLNNLGELAEQQAGSSETAMAFFLQAEQLFRKLHSRHAEIPKEAGQRLARGLDANRLESLRQEARQTNWEQKIDELLGAQQDL